MEFSLAKGHQRCRGNWCRPTDPPASCSEQWFSYLGVHRGTWAPCWNRLLISISHSRTRVVSKKLHDVYPGCSATGGQEATFPEPSIGQGPSQRPYWSWRALSKFRAGLCRDRPGDKLYTFFSLDDCHCKKLIFVSLEIRITTASCPSLTLLPFCFHNFLSCLLYVDISSLCELWMFIRLPPQWFLAMQKTVAVGFVIIRHGFIFP